MQGLGGGKAGKEQMEDREAEVPSGRSPLAESMSVDRKAKEDEAL